VERVERPGSMEEALALLAREPAAVPIAGGTDLVVQLRGGRRRAPVLVDLGRLDLAWIRETPAGLEIGAGTPMDLIARSPLVRAAAPALADAAGLVGAWPIQCRATLGGNLANASPAADTAPPLLVADATVELVSGAGSRRVAVDELFVGPGTTVLERGELIRSVSVPRLGPRAFERFAKVGPRREQVIAVVSVAVRAAVGPRGELREVRLAVGSSAPRPVRARHAESVLEGRVAVDGVRLEAAEALQLDLAPIDDVRAPAEYRRVAAAVLLDRFLRGAADA